jgi:hypothetical protein
MATGAALALAGGGLAVALGSGAFADSAPTPTPTGSAGTQQAPDAHGWDGPGRHHGWGRGPMGRMGERGPVLHGELVVPDGTGSATRTVLVQQGEVTAKGSDTVTVKSTDGFTVTWEVTSSTRGTLTDIVVGDQVHAAGNKTATATATADVLREKRVRPDGQSKRQRTAPTPTTTSGAAA